MEQCGAVISFPQNISLCHNQNDSIALSYDYDRDHFEVAVELYIIPLLCGIGIFGNLISIIVLHCDNERKDALMLLQALAVADGFYLLIALLRYPTHYFISDQSYYTKMQIVVFPLLKCGQTSAVWMMVLVTVDRYIYVCMPLRAHDVFTLRNRRLFSVVVFILAVLFNTPRFMDSCVYTFYNVCKNVAISKSVIKPPFLSKYYTGIYKFGLFFIFVYLGPLTLLTVLNTKLIRTIQRAKRRQQEMRRRPKNLKVSHSSETNANLVLVIIVVVFIVCETPEMIIIILRNIKKLLLPHDTYILTEPLVRILTKVSELLMVVNCSTNFMIYCAFGKRFRYVMKETFKKLSSVGTVTTQESVPLHVHRNLAVNQYAPCPQNLEQACGGNVVKGRG